MSGKYDISLPEGTDIGGYRLLRVLGDGGFGITYLAENFQKEKFAIKEYLPNQFAVRGRDGIEVHPRAEANREDFEWGRRRFVEEADLLARFEHPNIVKVKHFLEMNNTAYIVMEYEDGEPLDKLLRCREKERGVSRLTEAELKHILFPIADGLRDVHREGVCHRDIKPANIFIRRSDGSPVLLDFGAARNALGRKSMSVAAIVSPPYSPPEQYDYEAVLGPSTDIYALSALCYRAITGRPPAESPRRQGRVYKGEEDPLPALTEAEPPGYSRALLEAVDWGLRLDEKERPQSVEEWLVAMEGTRTPPPSPPTSNNVAMRNEEALEKPDDDNAGSEQKGVERDAEEQAQPRRSRLAKDGLGTGVFRKMKIMRGKYGLVGLVGVFLGFAVSALVLLFGAQRVVDKLGLRPAPHVAPPPAPIESDPPVVDPLKGGGGRTPDTRPIAVPTPPPTDPEPPRPTLDCPTCPPFTVRTGPPDARVQIMNIGPRYEPGIKLPPGSYDVRVTAPRRPANGTFTAREFDTVERTLQHDDEQKDRWIGVPFYDCPVCPKMVELPKGSYTMGTSKEEDISRLGKERYTDEGPAHEVKIRYSLAMGVFEVSFEEWDACVGDGGCTGHLRDEAMGHGKGPVVHATMTDAKEYTNWLTARTGRPYRLPSEAEWEYAARAGTSFGRHWGSTLEGQCTHENGADVTAREDTNWTRLANPVDYHVPRCSDGYVYAAPNDETRFRANPWGLYHMLGNVTEWTVDCWHKNYVGAPQDGSAWVRNCRHVDPVLWGIHLLPNESRDKVLHVVRGGSWKTPPTRVRAPTRWAADPAKGAEDLGFRVAVEIARRKNVAQVVFGTHD